MSVNIVLGLVIAAIVAAASAYIYKNRKKGGKCIGCPGSCTCAGECGGCCGDK